MRRILVTGAGGFVGRHAMAAFARELRAGDRLAGVGRDPIPDLPEGAEDVRLDLLDGAAVSAFVAGFRPTHVLHLAALSSVGQSASSPAETWRSNLVGLLNLAEAVAREARGSAFYFVSSGEVYGRAFLSGTAATETTTPQPGNAYARTKLAGEQMLGDVLPAGDVKLIILRPFNHIGRGQDERFVVASFAGQIARIEAGRVPPAIEVGDLSSQRDFLDVGDVVNAYAMLLKQSDALANGSIFNISSGRARPISEILNLLRAKARVPFDVQVAQGRLRASEIPTAVGDSSALAAAVGWQPVVPWAETMQLVLDDARSRASLATE